MTVVVQVEGLRALDAALAELPKSVAAATLRRTLVKAGEPIAEAARAAAPVQKPDGGQLRDSIKVSSRVKNTVGKSEFAAVMRQSGGLDIAGARQALRDARRAAPGKSFAEMYVGPARGSGVIRYAHLQEFGTVNHAAQPYMRPAWDSKKDDALRIIRDELGNQIIAAAKRVGRGKRYAADIKYRASLAALLAVEAAG